MPSAPLHSYLCSRGDVSIMAVFCCRCGILWQICRSVLSEGPFVTTSPPRRYFVFFFFSLSLVVLGASVGLRWKLAADLPIPACTVASQRGQARRVCATRTRGLWDSDHFRAGVSAAEGGSSIPRWFICARKSKCHLVGTEGAFLSEDAACACTVLTAVRGGESKPAKLSEKQAALETVESLVTLPSSSVPSFVHFFKSSIFKKKKKAGCGWEESYVEGNVRGSKVATLLASPVQRTQEHEHSGEILRVNSSWSGSLRSKHAV